MDLLDVPEPGGDEHSPIRKPVQESRRTRLLVALQARGNLRVRAGNAFEDETAALDVRQVR